MTGNRFEYRFEQRLSDSGVFQTSDSRDPSEVKMIFLLSC